MNYELIVVHAFASHAVGERITDPATVEVILGGPNAVHVVKRIAEKAPEKAPEPKPEPAASEPRAAQPAPAAPVSRAPATAASAA